MGLVLNFNIPVDRALRRPPNQPGEVALFTGVRYERYEQSPDDSDRRSSSGNKPGPRRQKKF